jgi:WD40 repeat protein
MGSDLLASGGNSSLILLHSLESLKSDAVDCLIGHALNVCTLAYSPVLEKLVSGSWDHTARVWSRATGEWKCELILEGHVEAVWGVAAIDGGDRRGCFLSGKSSV